MSMDDTMARMTLQQEYYGNQAARVVDRWQERLGLSDWDIRCVFVHVTVMDDGAVGTIELGNEPRVAILVLAVERLEMDLEETVIEELQRLVVMRGGPRGN